MPTHEGGLVKFDIEKCPECGEAPVKILEGATGFYPLLPPGDPENYENEDEFDYDTETGGEGADFDGPVYDIDERVSLICANLHDWMTREADAPAMRMNDEKTICWIRIKEALSWEVSIGANFLAELESAATNMLGRRGPFDIDVQDGCFVLWLKKEES
jgi:hypothetical protein